MAYDGEEEDEGKLNCPKCATRLGRFRLTGTGTIECSCGAQKKAPAFAYAKKKLGVLSSYPPPIFFILNFIFKDIILPIEDARAAMVSLRLQDETRAVEHEVDDDDGNASKKKKRQKKQKKTNAANFSSFRNKSYGVKAPNKQQKKQDGDAVEVEDDDDDDDDDEEDE